MTALVLGSVITSVQFWSFVGVVAGIFTIFALGLQVQFGFTGLLNFGHVAFMAIGAYTMAILVVRYEWPLWAASLCAIAAAMVVGLLLGIPTVRLRADFLAIATIAFGEIVRLIALNESSLTGGPQGTINLRGAGTATSYNTEWNSFVSTVQGWLEAIFDGVSRDQTMLVIVWTAAIGFIILLQFAVHSPWGRVLRSIREDEDAASALGKNPFFYKLQSLMVGGALGAIAGLFYAFHFSFFSPQDFLPLTTFFAWIIVILGGTARMWAVPVGAIVFGVIFAGTRFFDFWPFTEFDAAERAYLRLIIIGLILIGLMAFRPQGIFGKKEEMVLE